MRRCRWCLGTSWRKTSNTWIATSSAWETVSHRSGIYISICVLRGSVRSMSVRVRWRFYELSSLKVLKRGLSNPHFNSSYDIVYTLEALRPLEGYTRGFSAFSQFLIFLMNIPENTVDTLTNRRPIRSEPHNRGSSSNGLLAFKVEAEDYTFYTFARNTSAAKWNAIKTIRAHGLLGGSLWPNPISAIRLPLFDDSPLKVGCGRRTFQSFS